MPNPDGSTGRTGSVSTAARDPSCKGGTRAREEMLLRRYASLRTAQLRDEIVELFMPLARSLAMRYRTSREPFDDLLQVASLGLLGAIDRFDPGRAAPFRAFAVPTILGELRRHFRDHGSMLRLPRPLQELTIRVDKATDALTEEIGRAPSTAQIAGYLGLGVDRVDESLEANSARRTLSLDAPSGAEVDGPRAPVIDQVGCRDGGYGFAETRIAVAGAGLDERERKVLLMGFVDGLSQAQIGRRVGVSQMQVSRINRGALWKLLAAERGEPVLGPPPKSRRSRGVSCSERRAVVPTGEPHQR